MSDSEKKSISEIIKSYSDESYQNLASFSETTDGEYISEIVDTGFQSIVHVIEQSFLENVQTYIATMKNSIGIIKDSFNPTQAELNNFQAHYLEKNPAPRMNLKDLSNDHYDIVSKNPIKIIECIYDLVNDHNIPELLPFFSKNVWIDASTEIENIKNYNNDDFYRMLIASTKQPNEIQEVIKNSPLIHELRAINFIITISPTKNDSFEFNDNNSINELIEKFNLNNPNFSKEYLNEQEKTQMVRCIYSQIANFSNFSNSTFILDKIHATVNFQIENNISLDMSDSKLIHFHAKLNSVKNNQNYFNIAEYIETVNHRIYISKNMDSKTIQSIEHDSPVMKL